MNAQESRRRFLQGAAVAGAFPFGEALAAAPAAPAKAPGSPQEALELLAQGNARFARGELTAPHRNLARLEDTGKVTAVKL